MSGMEQEREEGALRKCAQDLNDIAERFTGPQLFVRLQTYEAEHAEVADLHNLWCTAGGNARTEQGPARGCPCHLPCHCAMAR